MYRALHFGAAPVGVYIDDGEVRQCLRGPNPTPDCAVPRKRHQRHDATGRGDRGLVRGVASESRQRRRGPLLAAGRAACHERDERVDNRRAVLGLI